MFSSGSGNRASHRPEPVLDEGGTQVNECRDSHCHPLPAQAATTPSVLFPLPFHALGLLPSLFFFKARRIFSKIPGDRECQNPRSGNGTGPHQALEPGRSQKPTSSLILSGATESPHLCLLLLSVHGQFQPIAQTD